MAKIVEVAQRASFTTTVAHTAVAAAQAAGLNSDWTTGVAITAALAGSYFYDSHILGDGRQNGTPRSQRAHAKASVQNASTSSGHSNVTTEAALGTNWERYSEDLVSWNLLEDGPDTGLAARLEALAENQSHFGRLPATMGAIEQNLLASRPSFQKPALRRTYVPWERHPTWSRTTSRSAIWSPVPTFLRAPLEHRCALSYTRSSAVRSPYAGPR